MITIPMKKCNKINCNELINFNKSYCKKHESETNKYNKEYYDNNKEVKKIYNRKIWKNTKDNVTRRDNNMCLYCLANGKYTKSECVDHFIPIRDNPKLAYVNSNLISCCFQCNTLKAYDEDKLRNNLITIEEYKSKWKFKIDG